MGPNYQRGTLAEKKERLENAIRLYLRNADNPEFDYRAFCAWQGVSPTTLRRELNKRGIGTNKFRAYEDFRESRKGSKNDA